MVVCLLWLLGIKNNIAVVEDLYAFWHPVRGKCITFSTATHYHQTMLRYEVGPAAPEAEQTDSRVPYILGSCITLLFLSLVLCILRIYTRCRPVMKLWWDDYFMIIAMVSGDLP